MAVIRPSADIRNNYNEISDFCHKYSEPVYITKNGRGDLAVISIEDYENLLARLELYSALAEGLKDIQNGDVLPFSEGMSQIRKELGL